MKTTVDNKKRVLIVDDHPLFRVGLGRIIDQQDDMVVCAEASDGPGGLMAVGKHKPDAVVVDISLEKGSGLDLIKDIHAQFEALPILALSVHHENLYAERAIHAGAKGYVMKRASNESLLAALRKVLGGQVAVSEEIVSRLIERRSHAKTKDLPCEPDQLLSDRELEVFRLIGQGEGTRQIAAKLGVAKSTVESYRASIKQKMGLANGPTLVTRAAAYMAQESG